MLKTKEIHKIHKGYMILSEITVFASDYILSRIHLMLKRSTNAAALVNAMQSIMMPPVLKALFKLFLASMPWMFEVESISSVHAAECG